jgi:hypothetical protein
VSRTTAPPSTQGQPRGRGLHRGGRGGRAGGGFAPRWRRFNGDLGAGFGKSPVARLLGEKLRQKKAQAALVEVDPLESATAEDLKDSEWYTRKVTQDLAGLARRLP